MIVSSGTKPASSDVSGRMSSVRMNRECQASSVKTRDCATTTLRWRGTGETIRLHDHATDEEINAAVRGAKAAGASEIATALRGLPAHR